VAAPVATSNSPTPGTTPDHHDLLQWLGIENGSDFDPARAAAANRASELRKLVAPDTPAAALYRLFAAAGLRYAVGIPADARLETFSTAWHGLAVAARAVAAWWRLTNEHDLSPTSGPAAMAAATHRLVAARAGDRGLFNDAAHAYQTDETAVRQADARIRKPLALGPDRTW